MNAIFGRGPSPVIRLSIAIFASIVLLVIDSQTGTSTSLRSYLNSIVSPVFYVANAPREIVLWASDNLSSRASLIRENERLTKQLLEQSEKVQQFSFLEAENAKLRALLRSDVRDSTVKLIAEVMAVDSQLHRHMIIINRGAVHGVKEYQAVIDEYGVVGQVISVGTTTSRVILISDASHSTPVRIERNDVRAVVEGLGRLQTMKLIHIPHNTDIKQGDRLVTSGLGRLFPEGYPVATVESVNFDRSLPFAQVSVSPIARLDRSRYVLVLRNANQP